MTAENIELEISQPSHEEIINRAWSALEKNPDHQELRARFREFAAAAAVAADAAELTVFCAGEFAIDLLLALDDTQANHSPKSKAEILEMILDLCDLIFGDGE